MPQFIPANQASTVTFTSTITDPTLIRESVNLLRIDATGKATIVGNMHDDGKNGDVKANDNIFTLQTNLNEATAGGVMFQVSAAFLVAQGMPLRVKSTAFPVTVISMDSLQVSLPATPNAASGAVPAVTPISVTNTTSTFATAGSGDLVTVLTTSGTVTVKGIDIKPAANANQVQWMLERDPTDTVDVAVPGVAGSPGAQVTFSPSNAGNFRLSAFVDTNGNGKFDNGEQLRVLRIALVRATLQAGSTFSNTNTLSANGVAGVRTSGAANSAMSLKADYLLEGGGADRSIGTAAVTVGNVGNLLNDTFAIAYPVPVPVPAAPGNVAGTGMEQPGAATPMVDTVNVVKGAQPTGSSSPFRGNSATANLAPPAAGGRLLRLTSLDNPGFGWDNLHPTTTNPWGTTSGGNGFREFNVAFTNSYPRTYLSLNRADWTVTVAGKNNGAGAWQNTTSSITGDGALQAVGGASVQVLGLSFVREFTVVYKP